MKYKHDDVFSHSGYPKLEFYEICKETEFECDFSDHIELDLWRKYVLIGATAASTVLFQKPLGEISATTYGKSLIIEIHEECKKIVLSNGYDIGIEATNYNLKLITDKGSLLKASMLRDFESLYRRAVVTLGNFRR